MVENVDVAVGILSAGMLLETEGTSTSRKSTIFPWSLALVFQVPPAIGKNYVHAENAKTSGIGPLRNLFAHVAKIFEKT